MCSMLFDWDVDTDGDTDELGSEKMLKSSPLSSAVCVTVDLAVFIGILLTTNY